ncbi:NAD(P)-dependent oxidoreductase [Micromonospora sp. NBC_01655]|uniref:NAD-dependent epimerase/dehydratase family protein n=1 Tax=unclassified Micromonospora TaxID=2617518 RepID=UPI001404E940|nr:MULTISPECIES: NAD(P)-dependent oxidoreductase [unclassified Micromonospora]MCX4469509.1 NAD(P)-dependent oxidoreductase [Micromonospora sp. NBC_01655]
MTGRRPGGSVVVLGSSGFLGGHLGAAFEAAGWRVLRISSSPAGPAGEVELNLTPRAEDRLGALLAEAGADVVVNAAGRVWQMTEAQMTEANADLVTWTVRALLARRPGCRFIQLGSIHEYAPGGTGSGTPEDWPTEPVTPYGRSKLGGSEAVLRAARTEGLDGVVLRLANVCGPGTRPGSLLGAVTAHLAEVARGERSGAEAALRLPPLRAQRDFVDVRDVVDAVLAAAAAPAGRVAGQVVNIGSGRARPVRGIVDRMVALSGLAVDVVEAPPPAPTPGSPARVDVEWQQLDIDRAARLLGWRPRRGLDESLRDQLVTAGAAPVTRVDSEGD